MPLLRIKHCEGVLLCGLSANGGERMAEGMDLVEVRRDLQPPEVVRHLFNRQVGLGTCMEQSVSTDGIKTVNLSVSHIHAHT